MVKVKVCGITNLEDAVRSIQAGCDALGFVFYKKSSRYITPEQACQIIKQLPPHIIKMGVFANARENNVKRIAKLCKLDVLQFHGNESPEFCSKFKNRRIIKAFRVKDKMELSDILKYKPFAYLFDTFVESKMGGTGKKFDWKLIRHICDIKQPIFLSGGLTESNVRKAIEYIKPDWVDVSSSVEASPGKKDHRKVRNFIRTVKRISL